MKSIRALLATLAILSLQACAQDDLLRTEGLTLGAGDAMARNTALQIVDPWPNGVEDTDLLVPNTRSNDKVADAGAASPKPPVATTP